MKKKIEYQIPGFIRDMVNAKDEEYKREQEAKTIRTQNKILSLVPEMFRNFVVFSTNDFPHIVIEGFPKILIRKILSGDGEDFETLEFEPVSFFNSCGYTFRSENLEDLVVTIVHEIERAKKEDKQNEAS